NTGVYFYSDLGGGVKLDTIRLDRVDVSGFGSCALIIGSWNGSTGYRNISITNTALHDNADCGMNIYGYSPIMPGAYPHQNVYLGHVQAYNNSGIPTVTTRSTGTGIVLGQVQNATIERSLAYNNGYKNVARPGPGGIWTYESDRVTIQF